MHLFQDATEADFVKFQELSAEYASVNKVSDQPKNNIINGFHSKNVKFEDLFFLLISL